MKAHIPISCEMRRKINKEAEKAARKEIERERNDLTRRLFKLMLYCLNEKHHFGQKRCLETLGAITELVERSDTDEVFWEHIDRVVIDYLKMPFERDYTDNGQVISESRLKLKED